MSAVSLAKNQTISLTKSEGGALKNVIIGTGWGKKKAFLVSRSVDLDASCILTDVNNTRIDQVWFRQKTSACGSIVHSGDDRNGGGDANSPNEEIDMMLDRIPDQVQTVFITINSFTGETFKGIPNAFVSVKDKDTGVEEFRFSLSNAGGDFTALVLGKLTRSGSGWEFTALEIPANGRTIDALDNVIRNA